MRTDVPRNGGIPMTDKQKIDLITLPFQTIECQCTVLSDVTVQPLATRVFNYKRPRCSTSPTYAIKSRKTSFKLLPIFQTFTHLSNLFSNTIIVKMRKSPDGNTPPRLYLLAGKPDKFERCPARPCCKALFD